MLRVMLENFSVIIPIRTDQAVLPSSAPNGIVSTTPHKVLRAQSGPATKEELTPNLPPTPLGGVNRGILRGASSGSTPSNLSKSFAAISINKFLDSMSSPSDEYYYLIPGLLPKYPDLPMPLHSGFITLERTYHFNRFTPPGLIQTIFARIYTFEHDKPLSSVDGSSPNLCWDCAFEQVHGPVKIVAHLISGTAASSDAPLAGTSTEEEASQEFSSHLRIRGTGHMLNSHLILEQLDKYTVVTQQVLDEYPGLGHVRLSLTCPDCMINQTDERNRGEFRYSDLLGLQEAFQEIASSLLETKNKGSLNAKLHAQIRKWNSKRHTCPRNRCQIKSDMLIHLPQRLKLEIERASHAEKEINFLLDEVVRSSAVRLNTISKSVVKIMAANCGAEVISQVKLHLGRLETGKSLIAKVLLSTIQYSSGVIVALPEGHPLRSDAPCDFRFNEVLVLCCEHVITEAKEEDGRMKYTNLSLPDHGTAFIVGGKHSLNLRILIHFLVAISLFADSTRWLYLAEMIFQGSTYIGSESNFWDMCALRIVAPIRPLQQCAGVEEIEVILQGGAEGSTSPSRECSSFIDTGMEADRVDLMHPCISISPMHSIAVCTQHVAVDQVVRRLGYPLYPIMKEISVDWGRVEQNDPNGDILTSLLSENGASGGPVVDREGRLIGLLSRSHEFIKCSCVQHLRNLFDILRKL